MEISLPTYYTSNLQQNNSRIELEIEAPICPSQLHFAKLQALESTPQIKT